MTKRAWTILFAMLILPAAAPLSRGADPPSAVLVFAAASTTNALDEIKTQFTMQTGIELLTNYAASSTLAQQIVHGAEADVFLSADTKWADYLAQHDLVVRQQNLLGNRLVIIVAANAKADVRKPEDLLAAPIEHLALGEPQSVPAGRYAKQALTKLGLWERLQAKVVPADDVRHALAYVETSACEAGIVYATDAAISRKVRVAVALSAQLTEPIRYPIALLKQGQQSAGARSFYRYLSAMAAVKVFRKYGFTVLTEAQPGAESPR